MRSIIATIGEGFPRIRIGVGRPENDSIDHVLSPFLPEEREALPKIVGAVADAVEIWLNEGTDAAMRAINTWDPDKDR
jgi:PTH1 family peptidyl-tRNA hydrolase